MQSAPASGLSTLRKGMGRLLLRAVMLPGIFLLAAAFLFIAEMRYLVYSMESVDQADEVTSQIEDLQRLFVDMETGLRAYAATGNQELLQPYRDAQDQVQGRFDQISESASENPDQIAKIKTLHAAFLLWTEYSQQVLHHVQADGVFSQRELAQQMLFGKRLMDDIRQDVAAIAAAQARIRGIHVTQARTTQYVVFATTAILALGGCAILVVRTRREIHEIIQAHALSATNELLETLVKNAPVGLVMFDRNMRYIRASERWLNDVGLGGNDVIGKSHYEHFPELSDHLKEAHRRGLAGESLSGDGEWINAAGEYHTGRWVIQPYGEPGTQTSGIILFSEDTTEKKRNEDALRESEERFRTLVQHASDAFFLHDTEGRLIDVNQQACDSLGYTREELLGMTVFDIEEDFDAELAGQAWTQLKSTGPLTLEGRHRRKDGTRFPHEARLSAYQVGNRQFILGLVRDVTERRQFEMKLRESEQKLRMLAGRLLTAQEDERRSLARELHDDITQQLAFLSIELGKFAAELPVSDGLTRATAQALQKQALRASSDVRRLSHGLHPSVITDFGLSVALQEICEEFERVHGIAVEFEELVEDLRLADSQATCLYRVAQEAMQNAVVHGRANEVRVTLSDADGSIQLKVADNGAGFNADQIGGMAGLGIISMTERVRLARGTLLVASTPRVGTEITASLPSGGVEDESHENHGG